MSHQPDADPWRFPSRRSPVLSTKGMCSSSQPLATQIGVGILDAGGNCVDACVAMAAALNGSDCASSLRFKLN